MEEEEELLKKEPMKGIGIEERTMEGLKFALKAERNGKVRNELLFKLYSILKSNGKEGNRMSIYLSTESLTSAIRKTEIRN